MVWRICLARHWQHVVTPTLWVKTFGDKTKTIATTRGKRMRSPRDGRNQSWSELCLTNHVEPTTDAWG